MSQFWYSPESAVILAQAICKHAGSTGSVAVVSAPTLFCALKRLEGMHGAGLRVCVF